MAFILSSQDVRITQQSASIAARLGAVAIDTAIIFAMIYALEKAKVFELYDDDSTWVIAFLCTILPFMYPLFCEVLMSGQTIGKKVFHTRVVTIEGGGPKLTSFILRWMMLPFDIIGAMGIGELCVFFTKRQQRLGDIIAGTWVVRTKTYTTEHLSLSNYEVPEGFVQSYPRAKNLSPKQASLIAEVLEHYNAEEVSFASYDFVKEVEKVVGEAHEKDNYEFLSTVLDNYRYESAS